MPLSKRSIIIIILVMITVVVLDQYTKALVLANIERGGRIEVLSGSFDLVMTFNPGAAFGMLAQYPDSIRYVLLTITSLVALAAVLYFLFTDYRANRIAQVALAMILGGAVGNIIDRIRFGMVVDFLDVYIGEHHWPAFNVADSAICIGVALLLLFTRKPAVAK